MSVSWKVYLDFDNDGFGAGDEITQYVIDANWALGLANEDEMTAGEQSLSMTVRNDELHFSPEATAGAWYGKWFPKRRMQVQSVSSLGTVVHWTGYFDKVQPQPGSNSDKRATITGVGPKKYLEEQDIHTELLTNVTADQVIREVFDLAGEYPVGGGLGLTLGHATLGTIGNLLADLESGFSLETGQATFAYVGDSWERGVTAYQAIAEATRAERGRFYFDREGVATFWNSNHMQSLYSVQGTVDNAVTLNYVFGEIVNDAEVVVQPRTISAGTNELLWQLEDDIELTSGKERTVRARYAEADSELEISGRSFQPLTITYTPANVWIETRVSFEAKSAEIYVRNPSNQTITISDIQVRGQKMTRQKKMEIRRENADSVGLYGRNSKKVDTAFLSDIAAAESLAYWVANRRATPIGEVKTLSVRTRPNDANLAQMISYSMGTVIRITDTQLDHAEDYIVIGEQHSLRDGLNLHDVTYNVVSTGHINVLLLDITGRSELDENVAGY